MRTQMTVAAKSMGVTKLIAMAAWCRSPTELHGVPVMESRLSIFSRSLAGRTQ